MSALQVSAGAAHGYGADQGAAHDNGAALYPLQTSPVLGVSACRLALRFPCLYYVNLLHSSLTSDKLS